MSPFSSHHHHGQLSKQYSISHGGGCHSHQTLTPVPVKCIFTKAGLTLSQPIRLQSITISFGRNRTMVYILFLLFSPFGIRLIVVCFFFLMSSNELSTTFVLLFFNFFYWSSICQHIAQHPVLILPSASFSAHHPVTLRPHPPPLPLPLVHFPELGVCHVLSPLLIFSLIFSPFPFIPYHKFLYSPNEWGHIMFVLQLTYCTQHNTLQFHPR